MSDLIHNIPYSVLLLAAAIVLGVARYIYVAVAPERPHKGFPLVPLPGGVFSGAAIRKGLAEHPGRPFQVMAPTGPRIVLPNSYADEIRSHPSLSLSQALVHDFDQDVQGFEALKAAKTTGMKEFDFLVEVVIKLTQSLGLFTPDLADETNRAVDEILGDNSEWHKMTIKKDCLELVARMANRIFLGQDICRNEKWLKLAREHSIEVMMTGRLLMTVNPLLRPIKQWFLEPCARLRKARDEANEIIRPEVQRKAAQFQKAREAGTKISSKTNSIACMYDTAKDKREVVDYSGNTLMLMMVSIHTTTEQLSQTLVNLIANPHLIQPLRDEVAAVVRAEGWSKTSLHNMKLMDAFLRESSRLNPLSHVSMNRRVVSPMTLSTGEELPVGAIVMISDNHSDPALYPEPQKFDPYRYINLPEGEKQSNYHVSLTPSNMAFGYGAHACPGRFLASNMMKVVLAMMVVNYDWRVGADNAQGAEGLRRDMDTKLLVLPDSKVELRARSKKEREVELGVLSF